MFNLTLKFQNSNLKQIWQAESGSDIVPSLIGIVLLTEGVKPSRCPDKESD